MGCFYARVAQDCYRDNFFTKLELITYMERKVKNLSGIMCDKKS